MAADWIKMACGLRRHPKVVRIASILASDKLRTVGALHAVWSVFDEHSVDGVLPGYTFEMMDDEIGWSGFSAAMHAVNWIAAQGNDGLVMPGFDTHNGASAKRRATDSERKRQTRNVPNVSGSSPQNVPPEPGPEKRREEKKKTTTQEAAAKVDTPPRAETPVERIAALRSVCVAHRVTCDTTKELMHLGQWANEGMTEQQLTDAITIARERKPAPAVIPIRYLLGIVTDLRSGAQKPIVPTGRDAIPIAIANLAAKEARERPPVVEEPPAPDPAVAAQAGAAEPEDGEFEVKWWNDSDLIVMRGSEEGVRVVPGQEFEEFTARVLAAAGPGPWMEAQDVDMRQRVAHWTAVGVNPASPQQAQRPAAQQRRG